MKLFILQFVSIFVLFLTTLTFAQDVSDPLTYQGMGQFSSMSARTRAMGGAAVAVGNDLGAVFSNPAVLTQLSGLQVQVSGLTFGTTYDQSQRWNPNRFYADMSLMFENKLDGIKDPEVITNPTDKIHRPFDKMLPDWNKSTNTTRPSMIAVSKSFNVMDMPLAVSLSYSELINLNHYYQNNNAINPVLGQYRPTPIPLVAVGDTLPVDWYQYIRKREGSIKGITPAFSINPFEGLHVGISVSILSGQSDDNQYSLGRGKMHLLYNAYLLDSANYSTASSGTSKYTGTLTTIGMVYTQEYYSIGFSLKPPATITRNWDAQSDTTTSAGTVSTTSNGSDALELPWMYTLGIALNPTEKWTLGLDYAIQNYSDATYTPDHGVTISPWVNSKVLRIGAEYNPKHWLAIRFGAREEATTFAPNGEGLIGEPARGSAYSAGLGLKFKKLTVNISGEYSILKYIDMWQSNVNTNNLSSYTGMIEFGYKFGQ